MEGKKVLPHMKTIERNFDVLQRCTDVSVYVIACLRAENVLDAAQESSINPIKSQYERNVLLYKWLKETQDVSKYETFLRVMERKDVGQQHVSNLLRGNVEDHELMVPLSESRFTRLVRIRPKLMNAFSGLNIDEELLSHLKGSRAISDTDYDEIDAQMASHKRSYMLVCAVMRRSNESYNLLKQALIDTHQKHLAAYLDEGEIPCVHVTTSRPDLDADLSAAFNEAVVHEPDVLSQLDGISLHAIMAQPGNSIEILIYCCKMEDIEKFIESLNSGNLEKIICHILNRLLRKIEPNNTDKLNAIITIDEAEAYALEEVTGIEDGFKEKSKLRGHHSKSVCSVAVQCKNDDFPDTQGYSKDIWSSKALRRRAEKGSGTPFRRVPAEKITEEIRPPDKPRRRSSNSSPAKLPVVHVFPEVSKHRRSMASHSISPVMSESLSTAKVTREIQIFESRRRSTPPGLGSSDDDDEFNPVLSKTVSLHRSNVHESKTTRMTILKGELYVSYERSSSVDIYDCSNCLFKEQKSTNDIIDPVDIASCSLSNCVYVLNQSIMFSLYRIIEILKFDSSFANVIAKWAVPPGSCHRISDYNDHVIVSFIEDGKPNIIEYDSNGSITGRVNLDLAKPPGGLFHWQAVRNRADGFVGILERPFPYCRIEFVIIDNKETVSLVKNATLEKSLRDNSNFVFAKHVGLFSLTKDKMGNVLVAAYNRVFLLNSSLEIKCEFIISGQADPIAPCISVEESGERLYIIDTDSNSLVMWLLHGTIKKTTPAAVNIISHQDPIDTREMKTSDTLSPHDNRLVNIVGPMIQE